ncbi:MAG: 2,3-bisphosphoglycerate-independent phosphoglycerate mutase [Candidatus Altiarchaeales archaeon]|nr:2,3-bisphosphoglycerate-independent phosphoglycerate mutase [Candidatus Altiarchaeales archaeon]
MSERVILVIRDGWGYRESREDNAIYNTPTPNTDMLMSEYPNVLINASGLAVGLPDGYQGNSEVGHMTIGSGRIIFQSMVRINKSIGEGSFFENPAFHEAIENCRENNSRLHMIGLLQSEGVHAHEDHLHALLELCAREGFKDVLVHVVTDGRDAPVTDSIGHVEKLLKKMGELGFGEVATVSGRYYTMDRDRRWDRIKKAYDCIVDGRCEEEFNDPVEAIRKSHEEGVTDEFIVPVKKAGYEGVKDNDSFIYYNFRTDRTRQLTQAMVDEDFPGWERKPLNICFVAMTHFYDGMNAEVAFKDTELTNLLGEVISKEGLKQFRISETEKYAHVTFFFNGQKEEPYPNEDRKLIHSPKVATYDLKPEMSVYEIRDSLVETIGKQEYDFIVANLVNGDMVGHTGVTEAIEKAVTAVDDCVGDIVNAGLENGYTLLVFADHGNAEDQTPEWRTSHTKNPVPVMLVSENTELQKAKLREGGGLADIAPTVLEIMDIEKPEEMTGKSIIG